MQIAKEWTILDMQVICRFFALTKSSGLYVKYKAYSQNVTECKYKGKFLNMWTIAAVNKKFDGPLGSYNGLTDVHLAHFFSRPSRRSHLKAAKLITDDGYIVPEKNVKVEFYLDEKKRRVYDILARSILQNAIHKEGSWNKKLCNYLEDISKMAAVDKARRTFRKKSGKVASELFSEHPIASSLSFEDGLSRTVVKQLNSRRKNVKPSTAPVTCFCFTNDGQHKVANLKRSLSAKLHSPYGTPLLLSGSYKEHSQSAFDYDKTSKHKKRKRGRGSNAIGNSYITEKKNLPENRIINVSIPQQTLKFSQCQITMLYHGHLHLCNFQKTLTQSILIKQQHCGGTPVVIYKGRISANEMLSFFSLDHEGFFFSITVFLNGIRELKLSSCCVFRYLPGRRLGGTNGTFSIKKIEGGKPCLKCQYQEFQNNNFKITSQISDISLANSPSKENSIAIPAADIDDKDKITDKISVDLSEAEESPRVDDIPNADDAVSEHDTESLKMINTERSADDDIEEILDDLQNDGTKKSVSSDEVGDESNGSSIEEDEIKESSEEEIKEQEESNHSVASSSQSEVSENFVEEPKKYHEISIGSSSSEDEGENQHIVTVSVHESPENS